MPKLSAVLGGRGRRPAAPESKRVAWWEDLAYLGAAWPAASEQQGPPSVGASRSVASAAERPCGGEDDIIELALSASERPATGNAGEHDSPLRPDVSSAGPPGAEPAAAPQLEGVPQLWTTMGGVFPSRRHERKGAKPTQIKEASALRKLRNAQPALPRVTRLTENKKLEARKASAEAGLAAAASTDLEGPDTPCDSGEALAPAPKRQPATHPAAGVPAKRQKRVLRLWPDLVQRRRTSVTVREVPVNAGFHIRNLSRADFEAATQPHPRAYRLDLWEPFDPPDEAAAPQQAAGGELAVLSAAAAAAAAAGEAGGSGDAAMLGS